jgi:hypothetical protein
MYVLGIGRDTLVLILRTWVIEVVMNDQGGIPTMYYYYHYYVSKKRIIPGSYVGDLLVEQEDIWTKSPSLSLLEEMD